MPARVDEYILRFRKLTGRELYRNDDGRVVSIAFGKHYLVSRETETRWVQELARRSLKKHPG